MSRTAAKLKTDTAALADDQSEPLQPSIDALIEMVAEAEVADTRPRLAFVQFKTPARIGGRGATPLVAWGKGARLYVEEVPGIGKCVVAEGKPYPKRGYVPWENVAAFGFVQ